VKSNLTDWCFQKLSKRDLNALTVQASTTELGKLLSILLVLGIHNIRKTRSSLRRDLQK